MTDTTDAGAGLQQHPYATALNRLAVVRGVAYFARWNGAIMEKEVRGGDGGCGHKGAPVVNI